MIIEQKLFNLKKRNNSKINLGRFPQENLGARLSAVFLVGISFAYHPKDAALILNAEILNSKHAHVSPYGGRLRGRMISQQSLQEFSIFYHCHKSWNQLSEAYHEDQ